MSKEKYLPVIIRYQDHMNSRTTVTSITMYYTTNRGVTIHFVNKDDKKVKLWVPNERIFEIIELEEEE